MRETLADTITLSNAEQLSDQFSVDENTDEVTLTFVYVKDTEAGINITIERADFADNIWATLADAAAVGTNPLQAWTLQMSASATLSYKLKIDAFGFYRVRFKTQDAVAKYGTLSIYVTKDKSYA